MVNDAAYVCILSKIRLCMVVVYASVRFQHFVDEDVWYQADTDGDLVNNRKTGQIKAAAIYGRIEKSQLNTFKTLILLTLCI